MEGKFDLFSLKELKIMQNKQKLARWGENHKIYNNAGGHGQIYGGHGQI
jgi:hypothetical protein